MRDNALNFLLLCISLSLISANCACSQDMWTRTYGGNDIDDAMSVQQTLDGGYIVAGGTSSFGAGGQDAWLIKTDTSGDTVWTKTHGGLYDDRAYCVRQTLEEGYIITGFTTISESSDMDM